LDYVYSDTINVLMGLNKRILDVSGRLSLLAPQPEALQVLKRAGINNILRIFDTEADLIKTSEDIILQTTSYKVSDLQALANEKPQSEFDQLRSEIGSVFGSQDNVGMDHGMPAQKMQPQQMRPPVQQPPIQKPAEISPSVSDEFDQAFQQFEGFGDDDQQGYSSQPPQQQYAPPVQPPRNAPSYRQPPPAAPVQPPQFQGRQYVPPSPAPQTSRFDAIPKTPARTGYVPPEPPKVAPDYATSRTETQRFQTVSSTSSHPGMKMDQMPPQSASVGDDTFDEFSPSKKGGKGKIILDDSDSLDSDDDFDSEIKKKSPVGLIIAILLVLIIGGVVAYLALNQLSSKPSKTLAVKPPATVPSVPQPQVPETEVAPQVTDSSSSIPAVSETPKPEVREPVNIAISKPETSKPVPKPRSKPRPAATPSYTPPPTPREPSTPRASTVNKVVITSTPSGASLEIDGDIVGTTPYTWTKPVFGLVNVTARKSGYQENSISFDYAGGSINQSITLDKEYTPPPPPPVATSAPARSYERSYEPVETTTPPPVVEDPEPALPPPPVSQPVVSSGDASIFIASIPPVADVYLNGKLIGKTNVSELKLPSGTHMLRFVKGPKEVTKEITVQTGKNPSQMVRLP
jgi:hypothetical protein